MKNVIEFLKKQPLITGLIGMLFVSLSVRYLRPRMVGHLEAGAIHLIGSDFSSMSAIGLGLLKTASSGISGLIYLFMYWKTRNLWAIAIAHGLFNYLIEFPSIVFQEAGAVVSNTQDYVSMTGELAVANLGAQLLIIALDIIILIWIWKWHMKDVDFEEIRRT